MSERLADQDARDRIRQDLATTLVVEAAAGTGKTTTLVGRMVAALAAGHAKLESLVALTFTEAAAGELKLRLRTELERMRQDPDCPPGGRDPAPRRAAEARGGAHRHDPRVLRRAACASGRSRPGVDPLFQVAPDDVAGVLFARAFGRWFERQLADPGPGRAAHPAAAHAHGRAARAPRRRRARARRVARLHRAVDAPPVRPRPRDRRDHGRAAALGPEPLPSSDRDVLGRSLHDVASFVEHVARREQLRGRDYDRPRSRSSWSCRAEALAWKGWVRANEIERKERRDRREP
jgi:hypothetical protein